MLKHTLSACQDYLCPLVSKYQVRPELCKLGRPIAVWIAVAEWHIGSGACAPCCKRECSQWLQINISRRHTSHCSTQVKKIHHLLWHWLFADARPHVLQPHLLEILASLCTSANTEVLTRA
jgi:hypothetical protein